MLRSIMLVAVGGATGSVLRFLASIIVDRYFQKTFPLATFSINMVGCFLMGLLLSWLDRHHATSPDLKYLLITGFCGGFTTFSAFGAEGLNLFQSQHILMALLYIAASSILGMFAVWLGMLAS